MPTVKKCPQCGCKFEGRANKIYCSGTCKNQKNNTPDAELRRTNRFWAKQFEHNERIFNNFMKNRSSKTNKIFKTELKEYGFCVHGPFWIIDGNYLIGNYRLRDKGPYFEVSQPFLLDLESSYSKYDFELSRKK